VETAKLRSGDNINMTHHPPAAAKRFRWLAIAAGAAFGLDLALVGMLLWPGLVPAEHRSALRLADFLMTGLMAALLVLLLLELFRAFKARREASARLQGVFDAMPTGLALWSADDRLELTNADFVRLYAPVAGLLVPGVRFEDLLRSVVQQGLVPEAAGREEAWIARRLELHRNPGEPMLRQLPGGRWRRIVEQRLADGRLLSYSIDVTELVTARADTDLARRRLEDAIEALPAGFELYDANDRLIVTNSLLRTMYPKVADLLGQPLTWEEIVRANRERGGLPEQEEHFETWLERRREQRRSEGPPRVQSLPGNTWIRTYERRTREGGIVGVRIDVSEVMLQDRELRRLNAELDAAVSELRRLAGTDPLTGIANRRTFEERLRAKWDTQEPLALLLLDVDHFKRYNDHHGHPAGDAVLRRVAAVLVATVRSPSDLVARVGGEEFAVLISNTDANSAMSTAERCLSLLADADIAHGDSPVGPRVTASIGVAWRNALPRDATPDRFVGLADAALYRAKSQGRNCARAAMPG
jgi:diguanylate cyclase (GGDEF)-like protein